MPGSMLLAGSTSTHCSLGGLQRAGARPSGRCCSSAPCCSSSLSSAPSQPAFGHTDAARWQARPAGRLSAAQVATNPEVMASATLASAPPKQTMGALPVAVAQEVLAAPAPGRLQNRASCFTEEHRIRAYEVGADQRTTIVTIANLLQEVAGNHGVALWGRTEEGFATDPIMVKMNLIFVATRIQIAMEQFPKWGDVVEFETWFQPEGRIGAARNWIIRNAATRQVLGRATSTWVMVNTVTRKLAKIPDEMRVKLNYFSPQPPRDALPASQTRLKIPEPHSPPELRGPTQVARRSDVDMNGHINNVTYLGWALETVPTDVYHNMHLAQVEIDFKAECHSGDTVESLGSPVTSLDSTEPTHKQFLHTLQRCDEAGCRELVRARTHWVPRDAAPRLAAGGAQALDGVNNAVSLNGAKPAKRAGKQ